MYDHFQALQRPAGYVATAPRCLEQEPDLSDYIRTSKIQDTRWPGPQDRTVPPLTTSQLMTPPRIARANGKTWSSTNCWYRSRTPTLQKASTEVLLQNVSGLHSLQAAQSPDNMALGNTINQSSMSTYSPQPISFNEAKVLDIRKQHLSHIQKDIIRSGAQQEGWVAAQQATNVSMTSTELGKSGNKRSRIQSDQSEEKLIFGNAHHRAVELERVQRLLVEEYPKASKGLLARKAAAEAQRQTVQAANKADHQRLELELAQRVKAVPGRLERAEASIAQRNPDWPQERVKEQALRSEVRHEALKIEQASNRKAQVDILLTIRPEHVERLHPNSPDHVKKEWMKKLAQARRWLQYEDHTTVQWKQSYQSLMEMGKKLQNARPQVEVGNTHEAASMNSPPSSQEQLVPPLLTQEQRKLNSFPWLTAPSCWRHDPYTNGYLVYNSFINRAEKANMFQNSIQTEEMPECDPRVQAQAYLLDLYNNSDFYHDYYPPASLHTDSHGLVHIGNTPFRSYGPDKAGQESEKEVCWPEVGASGYAGMPF
jgi:hypothetical protein